MRSRMVVRGAAGCLALVTVWSCSNLTDNGVNVVPTLNGIFPLVAIDENPLPAQQFPIPTRDGTRPTCFAVATRGWLELDLATQAFAQVLHLQDSCGGPTRFGSDTIAIGTFEVIDDSLAFNAVIGGGRNVLLTGRVRSSNIEVNYNNARYRYSR